MKRIAFLLSFVLLFTISYNAQSQNISAHAYLDTNNLLIGDQFRLKLVFSADKETKVVWPSIGDTLGALEVVTRSKIDTLDTNGIRLFKQNIILTCFDSGYHEVPPLTFMYERKGLASIYPTSTQPLYVKFNSIPVDTTKDFKDIKPPMDVPISWLEYLVYFLIAIGIVGVGFGAWFLWKRFKKKPAAALDYDPKIPPHVLALEALKQLNAEKLWQKGKVKHYHIQLTDIIRVYIERRFKIPALEMISDDIINEFRKLGLSSELIEKMSKVFDLANLAKFAKFQPIPDENSLSMAYCLEFVNATIALLPSEVSPNLTEEGK